MKSIFILSLLFAAALFFAACDHGANSHAHGPADHAAQALKLDDGRRWKTDEPTRASVATIKERVADKTLEGKALGDALDKELQKLIQGCKMTGEAHNQLHYWLEPFMGHVKDLREGKAGAADKVKASLAEYDKYFE
jgi:hypothetical protein